MQSIGVNPNFMVNDNKLSERTLTGFLWMITGSGVQVILKIGVLAVLARLVSPKEFGLVGLAVILVEFSKMFSHMGVGPALVQRKELEQRHLTTGFSLSVLMGVFFGGGLMLLAPHLEDFFRMDGLAPVLRVASIIFLIDSLTLIGQALLQRNMKFKILAAVDVISYTLGYGAVGVVLAFKDWGVWALVIAHLSQAVLHALLVVIVQPFPKKPAFELSAFKELIYFGGGFTIARIANYIALQGDNLVIGRTLGAAALGIYGRAYQFMVMPAALFGTSLDKTLFPAMATIQDDKKRLGTAYLTGIEFIALAGIPLSVLMVLLAPEIIVVVLGSQWMAVVLPFQILASCIVFRMSYKISDTLVRATGAVYRRAWRQVVYAGMVIVGSYLGQFWGLQGVAFGVCLALLTNFLLMAQLSINLTSIRWIDIAKVHVRGLVLAFLSGAVAYSITLFCRLYFSSPLLILVVVVGVVTLLIVCALWLFPWVILGKRQQELLQKMIIKKVKQAYVLNSTILVG